jgi:hypothetical protein
MLGQKPGVEHVWIGEEHGGLVPEFSPGRSWGVPVIDTGQDALELEGVQGLGEGAELILAQGFGGKEEEGLGLGIREEDLEEGKEKAEAFPGSGAGGDDWIFPGPERIESLGLVGVQG